MPANFKQTIRMPAKAPLVESTVSGCPITSLVWQDGSALQYVDAFYDSSPHHFRFDGTIDASSVTGDVTLIVSPENYADYLVDVVITDATISGTLDLNYDADVTIVALDGSKSCGAGIVLKRSDSGY